MSFFLTWSRTGLKKKTCISFPFSQLFFLSNTMDDFDDIILDDYDPFTDNGDSKAASKSQQDDPLGPVDSPSKSKNPKKRRQDDRDDDPESVTPMKKRQPMKKLNQAL